MIGINDKQCQTRIYLKQQLQIFVSILQGNKYTINIITFSISLLLVFSLCSFPHFLPYFYLKWFLLGFSNFNYLFTSKKLIINNIIIYWKNIFFLIHKYMPQMCHWSSSYPSKQNKMKQSNFVSMKLSLVPALLLLTVLLFYQHQSSPNLNSITLSSLAHATSLAPSPSMSMEFSTPSSNVTLIPSSQKV